jgi:ABC-2 type transport system permease protein
MRGLYAIYRKELGHYFVSPVAYVCIGVFLVLSGFFFHVYLRYMIEQSFQMEMQSMRFGMAQEMDVPTLVMIQFFGLASTLILFFAPLLTMGVYAEERRRGTIELLMTSPVTEVEIVLGKFLASMTLYLLMLLPTASYMIFVFMKSEPTAPWRMLVAGYGGALLLGASLLAMGSFISSLTENQLIAGALTFTASLLIFVLHLVRGGDGGFEQVVSYLSVMRHSEDFTRGIVDTSSLIYYVSFIVLFIFLTVRSVDSMRWRRA